MQSVPSERVNVVPNDLAFRALGVSVPHTVVTAIGEDLTRELRVQKDCINLSERDGVTCELEVIPEEHEVTVVVSCGLLVVVGFRRKNVPIDVGIGKKAILLALWPPLRLTYL